MIETSLVSSGNVSFSPEKNFPQECLRNVAPPWPTLDNSKTILISTRNVYAMQSSAFRVPAMPDASGLTRSAQRGKGPTIRSGAAGSAGR